MKMTLEIDDDIVAAAKDVAARNEKTIDQVVSEFARRGQHLQPVIAYKNGIPVILSGPGSKPVTVELVRELMEEEFELPPRR